MRWIAAIGLTVTPTVASASSGLLDPPDPTRVAGGVLAETCEWPTAVSVRGADQPFCTATVVHPQVVLLAAHCIDPLYGWGDPDAFGFGEDGFDPEYEVTPMFCGWPPEWDQGYSEAFDVAYCVLSQEVDADFIPPLMGCEWDAMTPGTEVTIVGFGASVGILGNGGWVYTEGGGPKRTAPQTIEEVIDDGVYLLGNDAGGCPGDSGGPAMIQMTDGTWRVIGAASRIQEDPNPPPMDNNSCGYGTVYSSFSHIMPWLEAETGFDITPCHDADGTWNPDERCTQMPLAPQDPASTSGTWNDGCASQQLSGPGALCGPPIEEPEPPPGSTGADDTGSDDSTGPSLTSGPSMTTDASGGDSAGETTPLPGGTAEDSTSAGTDSGEQDDDAGVGCLCRARADHRGRAWWLLLPLGLAWRRRR